MTATDPRIEAVAETLEKRNENDDWEWCLGDAVAVLAAADAVDPLRQPGHVLEIRPTSYGIQHPPECRPNLLDCELEGVMSGKEAASAGPGRYPAEVGPDGELVLGARIEAAP